MHGVVYPTPVRVSHTRVGVAAGVNWVPVADAFEPSVNHPATSTKTLGLPFEDKMLTAPPAPTGTMTRLGTTVPAVKLTLEVSGTA